MSPIEQIDPADIGRFGIDEKHNLYWDGKLVHTSAVLKLTKVQSLVAILAGFATMLACIGTLANALAS